MNMVLVVKSSVSQVAGQSSQLAETYDAKWRETYPKGNVVIRDLAMDLVPHLTQKRLEGLMIGPDLRNET